MLVRLPDNFALDLDKIESILDRGERGIEITVDSGRKYYLPMSFNSFLSRYYQTKGGDTYVRWPVSSQ